MNPSPTLSGPDPLRRRFRSGHPAGRDPLRRLDQHRSVTPEVAFEQVGRIQAARKEADRQDDDFSIYLAVRTVPDVDLFRRFEDLGVTDLLCAPWMGVRAGEDDTPETIQVKRVEACEQFAEHIIAKMG